MLVVKHIAGQGHCAHVNDMVFDRCIKDGFYGPRDKEIVFNIIDDELDIVDDSHAPIIYGSQYHEIITYDVAVLIFSSRRIT